MDLEKKRKRKQINNHVQGRQFETGTHQLKNI